MAAHFRAGGETGRRRRVEVRDAVGNLLADGDQVTLIKSIRLTGDSQEIDCKFEGIKGQMEIYQWLFRQAGHKVSDIGYAPAR